MQPPQYESIFYTMQHATICVLHDNLLFCSAAQYWTDDKLKAAYQTWSGHDATSNPTLDIYQYHLYNDFDPRFNPCLPDSRRTLDASQVQKPILIGEVQVRLIV